LSNLKPTSTDGSAGSLGFNIFIDPSASDGALLAIPIVINRFKEGLYNFQVVVRYSYDIYLPTFTGDTDARLRAICQVMAENITIEDLVDSTKQLTTSDKLIFRRLWKLRDPSTGTVKTTLSSLSKFLKITRATVQHSMERLIAKGFLIYEKTVIDPGTPYHKRIYRFPQEFPAFDPPMGTRASAAPITLPQNPSLFPCTTA
jgi:predicted transcriptional regulator